MNISKDKEIEELYEKFKKPLFRFISYKVSDIHSAEEILNDVFFKAAKSMDSLKEKTKVQSWLYKIASNLIIDYYRRKKETYVDINDDISVEDDSNDETIYDDLSCCIEEFINNLPQQYSSALKGVYLDELTQLEYAQQNDFKLSTVKSQVKRGKESMKYFFEKCCTFEKDRLDNMTQCIPNSSCKSC